MTTRNEESAMTPAPRRTYRPAVRRVARAVMLALPALLVLAACGHAPDEATSSPIAAGVASLHVADRATPDHATPDQAAPDRATPDHAAPDHAGHEPLAADAPLPGASLYHLDAVWTDHRGETLQLADLRGRPVIVTMIYASCETACPILVRDAGRLFDALPEDVRDRTQVLVVSFDPARDAPERLAAYVDASGLDHPSWRFAVGEPHATRALAALLGVRYRELENGMFSHTNLITVLGADGAVRQRSEGLGLPVEPAVEAVTAALAGPAR